MASALARGMACALWVARPAPRLAIPRRQSPRWQSTRRQSQRGQSRSHHVIGSRRTPAGLARRDAGARRKTKRPPNWGGLDDPKL